MQDNQEKILVKSTFNAKACHNFAIIFYIFFFFFGLLVGLSQCELDLGAGFWIGLIFAIIMGGIIHLSLYASAKNNKLTLTNYKVSGTYRNMTLDIPIDSITSVSKGWQESVCITCPGNVYNIAFMGNRDAFCTELNNLLNERTKQTMRGVSNNESSKFEELTRLKQLLDNGIITQEEFDKKKKELLGL